MVVKSSFVSLRCVPNQSEINSTTGTTLSFIRFSPIPGGGRKSASRSQCMGNSDKGVFFINSPSPFCRSRRMLAHRERLFKWFYYLWFLCGSRQREISSRYDGSNCISRPDSLRLSSYQGFPRGHGKELNEFSICCITCECWRQLCDSILH